MIFYSVILIVGLIVGSFINGYIQRIRLRQSQISSPPHCPSCNTRLKTFDLIPRISYVILRGRCRCCSEQISVRYFLVELVSGLVSVILFAKYGLTADFGALLFLMYLLIAIFFIDLEHQIIPNELVIVGVMGGTILFLYNLFRPVLIYHDHFWWNPLLGLVSGSGFLLSVAFIGSLLYKNEEVMGMGDVKLFALIGLFLGWRMTLLALYISVILGGMTSLMLIFFGKANGKSRIPFGPYIVSGVFITVMWGWNIAHWYVRTFF